MQGGTKIETVMPKNQRTQRKILNFENWFNWEVSKVPKFDQIRPKFDFQSQFFISKIIRMFCY